MEAGPVGEVAEACQLMKQALEILDAQGAHQSAALLDTAIHSLPGAETGEWPDELGDLSSQP
jgi:hypothetical protein